MLGALIQPERFTRLRAIEALLGCETEDVSQDLPLLDGERIFGATNSAGLIPRDLL